MKRTTKKKRVELIIKVLKTKQGFAFSLDEWLRRINEHLASNRAFRNTKELAQAFRCVNGYGIIRLKRVTRMISPLNSFSTTIYSPVKAEDLKHETRTIQELTL